MADEDDAAHGARARRRARESRLEESRVKTFVPNRMDKKPINESIFQRVRMQLHKVAELHDLSEGSFTARNIHYPAKEENKKRNVLFHSVSRMFNSCGLISKLVDLHNQHEKIPAAVLHFLAFALK